MFRPPTKYSEYLQDVRKSIDYILKRVNAITGSLQLNGGVAMSATPTAVTDKNNTASPLKLSTNLVQIVGIGSTSATTSLLAQNSSLVTALRVNDDGNVGVGNSDAVTPSCLLDVIRHTTGSVNNNYQFRILNSADGLFPYSVFLLEHNNRTGVGNKGGSTMIIKDGYVNVHRAEITFDYFNSGSYSADGGSLRLLNSGQGNVYLATNGIDALRVFKDQGVQIGGIGTTLSSIARLQVVGSGSTSATTSFLVQNSGGNTALQVRDDRVIVMPGLPTSPAGLPSGALWNNFGILSIV